MSRVPFFHVMIKPRRPICNLDCPENRILETPDGKPGLNCLCEGYKSFFRHNDRGMRYMASALGTGRAPAGIMEGFAAENYREEAVG